MSADPGQLEQILLNLALNARDAMPHGGRVIIRLKDEHISDAFQRTHSWARQGRYALIVVEDTGEGMTPDVQASAFDPFYSTKGAGQGTGLGLSIVQDVVERHEGFIHLYSEPGSGTVVKVYLPVTGDRTVETAASDPPAQTGLDKGVVLMAEDEPFVRRAVSRVLERAGYQVLTATDGRDAMRQLDDGAAPDLFLLDVVMPLMSGPDVVRELRRRGVNTPVILASGYSDAVLEHDNMAGIPLIEKPYDPSALLALVEAQLEARDG